MEQKYKYTVLTILMGNYENLHEIICPLQNDVEYICVTDNLSLKSNTWNIVYDKDLDKEYYNGFDKTFRVRYNLFKYCHSDICVRIDGSIQLCKSLDPIIDEFNNGNYDIGVLIHPDRYLIKDELNAWKRIRNIDQYDMQLDYICNNIGYDINIKGLIQLGMSINRKSDITNIIDNNMLNILLCDKLSDNGHINRLDQTLFTAYIGKYWNNLKIFPISSNILINNCLQLYYHNSNTKVNSTYHKFNNYILFDKEVNAYL